MARKLTANDLFKLMNQAMSKSPSPVKSRSSSRSSNKLQYQQEFTNNGKPVGPETIQELTRVEAFVRSLHNTMFPLQNSTAATGWVTTVRGTYKAIRDYREKTKGQKAGMKGLRFHIVVAVILYCMFADTPATGPIPAPILIHFINETIKSSHEKNKPKPIDLKTFERYRTNRDMGIMQFIKSKKGICYQKLTIEAQIGYIGRKLLAFETKTILACKKLAHAIDLANMVNDKQPSYMFVIACLEIFSKNKFDSKKEFGIPRCSLDTVVEKILNSSDPKIMAALPIRASIPRLRS